MQLLHIVFFGLILIIPISAQAYVGPGVGLGAIASFIALVLAIIISLVGFVWLPLKRLLKKLKNSNCDDEETGNSKDENHEP